MATGMWDYLNNNEEQTQSTPTAAPRAATPQVQPKPAAGGMWDYLNSTESTQPEPVQQPASAQARPGFIQEMGNAWNSGIESMRQYTGGSAALLGNIGRRIGIPGAEGLEQMGSVAVADSKERQKAYAPTVGSYTDVNDLGSAARYAGYGLVSNVLPIVATAGLGLGGALAGRGAAVVAGKAAQQALPWVKTGSAIGAGAGSLGMEAGGIAAEQLGQPEGIDPGRALAYGVPAAAIDMIAPGMVASRLGAFRRIAGVADKATDAAPKSMLGKAWNALTGEVERGPGFSGLAKVMGKEAGKGAIVEPVQELAQTILERGGARKDMTGEEANREYIDTMLQSILPGGLFSGAGGAFAKKAQNKTTALGDYIDQKTAGEESLPGVVPPKEQTDAQGVPIGKKWLVHPGHAQTPDAWNDEISNIMAAQEEPAMPIAQEAQEDPLMMERHMGWGPQPEPFRGQETRSGFEQEVEQEKPIPDYETFAPQEKSALSEGLDLNDEAMKRKQEGRLTQGLGGIPAVQEQQAVIPEPQAQDVTKPDLGRSGASSVPSMLAPVEEVPGVPGPTKADVIKQAKDTKVPETPKTGQETKVPERMEVWEGMKLNREIISQAVSAYPELEKELITNKPRTRSQLLASIKNHLTDLEKSGNFKLPVQEKIRYFGTASKDGKSSLWKTTLNEKNESLSKPELVSTHKNLWEARKEADKLNAGSGGSFKIPTPTPAQLNEKEPAMNRVLPKERHPKKTVKAYKLFRTLKGRPGELFPLFIGKNEPTSVGEWIAAEHIPTKGYSARPGWHVGTTPSAPHLMAKDGSMQEGRVWAEVEVPADTNWQHYANQSPTGDIRNQVPEGGHYKFNVNSKQGKQWMIAGAIKVNRILSKEEVDSVNQRGEPYISLGGKVEYKSKPESRQYVDLEGNIRTREAWKVPTKLSEQSGLAEKTTAIHLSDKPISLLKPTPEGKFNQWSKVDEKRAAMDSKYTMPVSQPFAGIGKGELTKLGKFVKFAYSIVEGNNGKTSQDVFAGTAKIPNAVTIENHYDADKDPKKLWAHAHTIVNGVAKQGTNYHPTNVFANLVKQAGYDGFVQKAPVKGETWAVSFKNLEATPPAQGRVMVSQNVQKATKEPKTLRETLVRAYSEVAGQTEKLIKSLTKSYPEAKMGKTVMSAYQGEGSSGVLENSFDAHIEAPIQTLRALAARYGLEHQQEFVVAQIPPNKKFPANGQNITFDFPAGTKAEDISVAMKDAGLKEYRVISNTNNDKLSVHYFVFGNDKNAKLNVDQFFDVYQSMGTKGTFKHGSIYSELIGKDEYAKKIADYHGERRGKEILAEGIRRGERHRNAEATRVPNVKGIKGRSELDASTDPFKGVEDLNFKRPTNRKELEAELEVLRELGLDPEKIFRSNLTDEELFRLATIANNGGVLLGGDIVGFHPNTGKPLYFGVNYLKHNFFDQNNPNIWATSLAGSTSISRIQEKNSSRSVIIAAYPNLLGAMETNDRFQEALMDRLRKAYGTEYVNTVIVPQADAERLQNQANVYAAIEEARKKLPPGKKLSAAVIEDIKNKKKFYVSSAHIAVASYQPTGKEAKKLLLPGAKKVSLQGTARDIASPELLDHVGKVIAIARTKDFTFAPKDGETDQRVNAADTDNVERYPVEVNGETVFYLPEPILLKDFFEFHNNQKIKEYSALDKENTEPVEQRQPYEIPLEQWLEKFGPSTEEQKQGREEHRIAVENALAQNIHVNYDILKPHMGGSRVFGEKKLGFLRHALEWYNARNMNSFIANNKNPIMQMLLEASNANLSAWKEYADRKDNQDFAEKWIKNHPMEKGVPKFKLGRTIEFVQDLLPEAGTPVSYVELLKEAQENGWLTEQEWKDSNLINWLDGIEDTSVERDYIVDYLQFRNSVYEQVEYEKNNPERTFLNGVERSFRGHGISVKLSYGKMKDKNMQDFITRLAHVFHQKIHFVKSEGTFQFYGWQRDKDIMINVDSKDPHLYVMGHELVHALKTQAPDLYDALINTIKADDVLHGRYLQRIRHAYADTRIAKDIDRLNEELVGDIIGEFFLDKTFWRKMGDNNPTLLSKMYDLLSAVYDKLTKFFHGDASATAMLTDYKAALDKAAEVMSQFSNRMEMYSEAKAALAMDEDASYKLADNFNKMVNGVTHRGRPETPRFHSSDPEVQKRFNEAKIEHGKAWDKIKDQAVKAKNEFTRHFPWLDNTKDAETIEALYQHEQAPARARSRAIRELQGVTKGLDQNQYEIFRFATILPDFVQYAEAHQDNFKDGLPFGYANLNAIRRDMTKAQMMARQDPKISAAMDKRNSLMNNLRSLLVRAGVLPKDVLNNKDYFHHQVLAYLGSKSLGEDYDIQTPADIRKHKYGWQMARKGTSKDFNTEYLQAEYEVLAQGYVQLAAVSALKKVGKLDIMPQLQQEAASRGVDIKELVAEKKATGEWEEWQPEKGNFFYRAFTISDRLVEKTLKALDDELTLAQEQKIYDKLNNLKQVIALGGKKPTWLIPANVRKTLDSMSMPTDEALIGKASAFVMKSWKQYILLNPLRAIKYMMNNFTGDLDITFAYDYKIITKFAWQAAKDLWKFSHNQLLPESVKNGILKAERKGVIGTGITAVEIESLMSKFGTFKALTGERQGPWNWYWEKVQAFSNYRENILRLASYRYFQEKVNNNPTGGVHGASNAEAVDKIPDLDDRAAKLARELIGDYGNVSHAGQWIRKHMIPFYSWMEVNGPRYVRLMKNVKTEKEANALGFAVRGTAAKAGLLGVKALGLYAMVMLWNATMFPDEDDELKRNGRKQLHLILGRTADGSVRSIRFQGALSDALNWFGFDQPDKTIPDLISGRKSWHKQLKESALAPVNKVVLGSTPFVRTGLEAALGRSLFPDISRPKPIRDRTEHLLRSISLDLPYRYAKGIPTRGKDTDLLGTVFAYTDPGESAYYYTLQKMGEYLDDKGMSKGSYDPSDKSNALYYYKQAIKRGNKELAQDWLDKYKKLGGNSKSILESVKKSDPLAFLPIKERHPFIATLDAEDQRTLKDARDWWKKTYKGSSMYR